MWEKFRAIFTIPELRQKIFFTLILLGVFRIGYQIPLPVVEQQSRLAMEQNRGNPLFDFMTQVSLFSAADLRRITIFGLGIMPYISASIILQLLGSVYKPLEDLRKEGETGRKKINEYTRYLTVLMCLIQGAMFLSSMVSSSGQGIQRISPEFQTASGALHPMWFVNMLMVMTCGTMFVMWLGEQIDEFGIGNGISLLIMAGILAQMPNALIDLFKEVHEGGWGLGGLQHVGVEHLIVLACLFVAVVAGVVFMQLGQRQIPTQSAKHVRGRRVYGGNRQYLPLRLNQSGVMPIIFASSLLMIPSLLFGTLSAAMSSAEPGTVTHSIANVFSSVAGMFNRGTSLVYNLAYIALIYFFSYFWMAITFNPKEIAENLKDFGTFIPGYRPGRRTAEYLDKVMVRITYVGAAFLALVAIVPTIISGLMGVKPNVASFYGGTGLLIAVSVAFDLIQKIDSHLVMRDYRGLLEP
jgi:preprotein translocase subunit SecY